MEECHSSNARFAWDQWLMYPAQSAPPGGNRATILPPTTATGAIVNIHWRWQCCQAPGWLVAKQLDTNITRGTTSRFSRYKRPTQKVSFLCHSRSFPVICTPTGLWTCFFLNGLRTLWTHRPKTGILVESGWSDFFLSHFDEGFSKSSVIGICMIVHSLCLHEKWNESSQSYRKYILPRPLHVLAI